GGAAISSGVRASLAGGPRSSRRGSNRPPPMMPPPDTYSDLSGPLPPDKDPTESIPMGVIPTGAFAPKKGAKAKIVGVLAAILALIGIIAFAATRPNDAVQADATPPRVGTPPTGPETTGATTAAPVATAVDPGAVPTVDVDNLPKIPGPVSGQSAQSSQNSGSSSHEPHGSAASGTSSHGGKHGTHPATSATPAPSSTNRYGILD
ncbi:MAG TPA: hypothetical protein VF407_25560, partial [Polyangiaceae bacterium]